MKFLYFLSIPFLVAHDLDPNIEAEKFEISLIEHHRAKNTTIIHPNFILEFPNGWKVSRNNFIKMFLKKKPMEKIEVTGWFAPNGLLVMQKKDKSGGPEKISANFGKPDSSIKGGYVCIKLWEV